MTLEPHPAAASTATFDSGWLEVVHAHRVYYEQAGNPDGLPVVLLHGGPGSGSSPRQRIFFDPARYRVIQFDQRGCGRSEPMGATAHNSTAALVGDIERLREHLRIERWLVSGGSWGSTLAVIYSAQHRDRVSGVLLRAMFLAERADLDWYFNGSGAVSPEAYERFVAEIPRRWRRRVLTYLDRALSSDDEAKASRLAVAWMTYEATLNGDDPGAPAPVAPPLGGTAALSAKYRVQAHYLARRCFLERGAVLRAIAELSALPVAIIHGTRDLVCLPRSAWRAHRACQRSRFAWAVGAGHNPFHPSMDALTRSALARFAESGDFSLWQPSALSPQPLLPA